MDERTSETRDSLYRIAILLFSLAGLASYAAAVPHERRRLALYVIREGEFAALRLLVQLLGQPSALLSFEAYWDAVTSDNPEDAILLSARLRLLAVAVGVLAQRTRGRRASRFPNWRKRCVPPGPGVRSELVSGTAVLGRPYIDTS